MTSSQFSISAGFTSTGIQPTAHRKKYIYIFFNSRKFHKAKLDLAHAQHHVELEDGVECGHALLRRWVSTGSSGHCAT